MKNIDTARAIYRYAPHKTRLLLKLIEIEVSFNLLNNDNKADCQKLENFQETLNLASDVSVSAIISCQGPFAPVPGFSDYFRLFV